MRFIGKKLAILSFQLVTIFAKSSVLDVRVGFEFESRVYSKQSNFFLKRCRRNLADFIIDFYMILSLLILE